MSDRLVGDRFRLLARLGQGQSQVWRAVDEWSGGSVAVKLYPGRAAPDVRVDHPNAVAVHQIGSHDGIGYVAMELIDGASLATSLAEGRLDRDDAVTIITAVCLALHAAHSSGITHGNLKPGNVLIAEEGMVKVGDFTGRGDRREDMYAVGLLMEAIAGRQDPTVKRLLSRRPYSPARLHEILTGSRPVGDDGDEDGWERPKLVRLAMITCAVTLAVVVAACTWFLRPATPPEVDFRTASSGPSSGPGATAGKPSVKAFPSPAGAVPAASSTPSASSGAPVAATGVSDAKAVVAQQLRAGQIQPQSAEFVDNKLDEIGRFQSRGQTKQAGDRVDALKSQLTSMLRAGKVTAEGYDAILAAVNKLSSP